MVETQGSPLNGGQVQLAKRYETILQTLDEKFPERFKFRDVSREFSEFGHGDLLKLRKRGLLRNEYDGSRKAKDWYLSRATKRWLNSRTDD